MGILDLIRRLKKQERLPAAREDVNEKIIIDESVKQDETKGIIGYGIEQEENERKYDKEKNEFLRSIECKVKYPSIEERIEKIKNEKIEELTDACMGEAIKLLGIDSFYLENPAVKNDIISTMKIIAQKADLNTDWRAWSSMWSRMREHIDFVANRYCELIGKISNNTYKEYSVDLDGKDVKMVIDKFHKVYKGKDDIENGFFVRENPFCGCLSFSFRGDEVKYIRDIKRGGFVKEQATVNKRNGDNQGYDESFIKEVYDSEGNLEECVECEVYHPDEVKSTISRIENELVYEKQWNKLLKCPNSSVYRTVSAKKGSNIYWQEFEHNGSASIVKVEKGPGLTNNPYSICKYPFKKVSCIREYPSEVVKKVGKEAVIRAAQFLAQKEESRNNIESNEIEY